MGFAPAGTDQRDRLSQDVAAVYAGHGGGAHGSGLDVTRGAMVSRAAVAPAPGAVKVAREHDDREGGRARCAYGQEKWPEVGLGNPM